MHEMIIRKRSFDIGKRVGVALVDILFVSQAVRQGPEHEATGERFLDEKFPVSINKVVFTNAKTEHIAAEFGRDADADIARRVARMSVGEGDNSSIERWVVRDLRCKWASTACAIVRRWIQILLRGHRTFLSFIIQLIEGFAPQAE